MFAEPLVVVGVLLAIPMIGGGVMGFSQSNIVEYGVWALLTGCLGGVLGFGVGNLLHEAAATPDFRLSLALGALGLTWGPLSFVSSVLVGRWTGSLR